MGAMPDTDEPPTFDAVCPLKCARDGDGAPTPWRSAAWPSEAQAETRLLEHMLEHRTGKPAPELAESRATADKRLSGADRSRAVAALREARNTGAVELDPPSDEEAE